jgi:hypothetical protein
VLGVVLSTQRQIPVFARSLPHSSPAVWTEAISDTTGFADDIAHFSLGRAPRRHGVAPLDQSEIDAPMPRT